jgi:hypothetical protein
LTVNSSKLVNDASNVPTDSADNAAPDVLIFADATYANVVSLGVVLLKVTLNSIELVVPLTTEKGNVFAADTVNCPAEAPAISMLVILNEDIPDVGVNARAAEHRYVPAA